jgi:DNA-binding NarL/FixJ family response regulator
MGLTTRVLLADDHSMFRDALRGVIESGGSAKVVAETGDGREAVELVREHRPDIAVLDLWMPRLSGEEATRQIVESGVKTRVLILSMHEDARPVRGAFRAGALGYVVKSAASSELLDAIAALLAGRTYVSPSVAHHLVSALDEEQRGEDPLASLTEREREVLQLIAEGLSTKEVATQLGVSTKTADSHRSSLMRKLGVHKASELVRIAIREGMIAP